MSTDNEILSFMDLLDLDEEVVDSRLKSIMKRSSYSNKHLTSAIHLLKYKNLINSQEESECDNDEECNFIPKLIEEIHESNIDHVCKIISSVLSLNTSSIVSKAEHLLQQIIMEIELPSRHLEPGLSDSDDENENMSKILLKFKLCDCILDTVLNCGEKLSLHFCETPLENVLNTTNESLKVYFLTNTVPKLFEGIVGYNILDRIWEYLKQLEGENKNKALKILSALSGFFIPVADSRGNMTFKSDILFHNEFWSILLYGLMSNDPSVRKISIYLLKRAIDCLIGLKKNAHIKTEIETIFSWEYKNQEKLKQMWDNFFILMDSLEEKQSNIVLPSLQLFDGLNDIGCWLNCAFNVGLQHDNTQVKLNCIEYRLKTKIKSEKEAVTLLEALNDINLFDQEQQCKLLKDKIIVSFEDKDNFVNIFRSLAKVKWSPVPLYHISSLLAEGNLEQHTVEMDPTILIETIIAILKIPCNNLPIRKAVQVHISYFTKNCPNLQWAHLLNVYLLIKWDSGNKHNNPLVNKIENLNIDNDEKQELFRVISESHLNIDFGLIYLENHDKEIKIFLNILHEKSKKLQNIITRQYSDKTECFKDIVFLTQTYLKCVNDKDNFKISVIANICKELKTILQYVLSLLSDDSIRLTIEEIDLLFVGVHAMLQDDTSDNVKEILLQIYKFSILFLKDGNADLNKKIFSMYILNTLKDNVLLPEYGKNEMLNLKQALDIVKKIKFKETHDMDDMGRLRNVFFEKSCEVVNYLINERGAEKNYLNDILDFIENVTESGGYGCLKWILKIMTKILPLLLDEAVIQFDIGQFISRMWKEIEELKSNNQYSPCVEEFVNLLTQDSLLTKSMFNNVIILYCNKIVQYAPLKNSPLYYLVRNIHGMNITENLGQIVYVLCEILMYSPVPKKDHRIVDNVAVEISQNQMYGLDQNLFSVDYHFNFQIQYLAISTLCNIKCREIFATIASFIMKRIDENFRNKQRYHGNSQMHRTLLIGLQHILLHSLLDVNTLKSENIATWSIELLGKLPHQPSVRICLEWFIALHFYYRKTILNEALLDNFEKQKVPLTSQFLIIYWLLKHKLAKDDVEKEEYEFVMDALLSHTMGQMFSIRLHAQYLAFKLYVLKKDERSKYDCIIQIIEKTFDESSKDKSFVKLKEDFFINEFDIVNNLTPSFVYHFLPKYWDVGGNEKIDEKYIRILTNNAVKRLCKNNLENSFEKEWNENHKTEDEVLWSNFNRFLDCNVNKENNESMGTIQKKYVPWKNMSGIDVYESGKKKESSSELIVVASLIDKLPNLGGMARTSEVFGVKTYVVDSLRHLQDRQFQGLSVSAERWVNIEEIRPGQPLKEYLLKKKCEGYSVVAAEQTSTSCQLQKFRFPKKTLLLLGHEKEGIPCDLLPIMDHCVEIPQQGFVRSLNVHVTAAIFVWEYSRQNIL